MNQNNSNTNTPVVNQPAGDQAPVDEALEIVSFIHPDANDPIGPHGYSFTVVTNKKTNLQVSYFNKTTMGNVFDGVTDINVEDSIITSYIASNPSSVMVFNGGLDTNHVVTSTDLDLVKGNTYEYKFQVTDESGNVITQHFTGSDGSQINWSEGQSIKF